MAVEKVRVSFYVTHTYDSDVSFTLTAPDGSTSCVLVFDEGLANDNYGTSTADADRTVLDDDAATAISAGTAPFVGTYKPESPLSVFNGLDSTGIWTFKAVDDEAGDTGTVQAVTIFITEGGVETRYDATSALPAAIPDNTPGGVAVSIGVNLPPPEDPDPDTAATTGGIGLIDQAAPPGYFRIKITSLHHPGPTPSPAVTLARLEDFSDASVTIPINDQRTATATISMHDPACAAVKPYESLLHILYVTPNASHLVFWGIVTQPVWNSADETLTIPAVDMSLKLQWRQVRFGTRILNASNDPDAPNQFNGMGSRRSTGHVPLDYVGLRWIRDAARNNGPQNARGVPPLGITDGINTADALPDDTTYKIEARRGDTLWDVWQQVVGYQIAPDFELEPRDQSFGVYARLNTWPRQGSSDATRIVFHDGFGLDNCLITYQPGGKLYTATHVLSTGDQTRVTVSDDDAEDTYGLYIKWDSTDYPATAAGTLRNLGQQTIDAYSTPPDYFLISPNPDCGLYYLDHLAVGDAMTAAVRRGQLKRQVTGDIRSVKLTQADQAGNVTLGLDVAVSVSRTTTDDGDV